MRRVKTRQDKRFQVSFDRYPSRDGLEMGFVLLKKRFFISNPNFTRIGETIRAMIYGFQYNSYHNGLT